ncbi:MAG: hypothetical protein AAFN74_07665 [Myxococcota bacterium]
MARIFIRNAPSLALLLAAAFVGCSSDSDPGNNNNGNECLADPGCIGCVADGDCCEISNNCAAGRICNLPTADLFDPDQPEKICIRVTCETNADCDDGKVCGRDKICRNEICQNNAPCNAGEICLNGTCSAPPTSDQVDSCTVVSRSTSLSSGASVTLSAVAQNANGATLAGIEFDWTSSATDVVSVNGDVASGGAVEGTANLTATPAGTTLACDGSVAIRNFPAVAAGSTRIVVAEDGAGGPVNEANVIVMTAEGSQTGMTGESGALTVAIDPANVVSVTVEKEGWQLFSVIQPGSNDIFIPLPKNPDVTVAGGFRGVLDLSSTRSGDIQFGFAGPAIPENLLDFGAESLVGDILDTEINAPELNLNDTFPLPAGLLFSIGTSNFTATADRCNGRTPGDDDLGCYLARAPAGATAGWALGGQIRISEITGLVNELSGLLGGGDGDIPIGDILTGVLPLLRRFNHGINASLSVENFPKERADGSGASCTDPSIPEYDDVCIADFDQYIDADISLTQGLNILASVGVPDLPMVDTSSCASGAVMLTASRVPGRGLIPLGLSAGLSTSDTNCTVAGATAPFGSGTDDIPAGRMPLSMATPHSGIEGSETVLLLVALDIDQLISTAGAGFQVSAILNRVDSVANDQEVTGSFLPFPTGAVDRDDASVSFTSSLNGVTLTRAEILSGDRTWLVYAPPSASIQLPNVATGREIVNNATSAVILTIQTRNDVEFDDVWQFSSGTTLDRLFDIADAFVVSDCTENAAGNCRLQ